MSTDATTPRSEQRFERLGVKLPRSTMCDWMASAAELLTPLWQLLKHWVLQSKVLHTDDTTVPVRDETKSNHRYGRLWDYIGDQDHPGIVFDYTTTHARDGPAEFLKDFKGFLQADAYGGYDGIYTGSNGAIVEVGCMAHAANKFSEADSTDPERVLAAKAWVRNFYDVEDEAKAIIAAEKLTGAAAAAVRLRLRKEKAVPLLTSLRQWLVEQKEQVLPKSPIAAAINYMLNQWDALNRYTSDGDLHIDNNISERTLKLIGMGRINWLFLGSDKGGLTAAVLFSFTATCKHLHIDTFAYPDKKATETKAAELERRGIRIDAGLVDPADVHAKRPLAEHAEDFRRYLAAKGNTSEHVGHTMSRLLACLDGCRFIKIGDLQPSAVVGFLADLRAAGKSIATANYYLVATKSFTRWLWRDKRVAADPLAGMSKLAHADTDVRHARREWSADECLRLFEAARTSNRPYRFLTGPDRFALYLTSAGTGLRASELASLTPASFELDATPAVVRLQSAYAKNRKQAELPLPAEVADVLRDYLASKPADLPIWPGTWNQDAAEMIRGDLNEAREQWLQSIQDARQRTQAEQSDFLAYCDTEGRFIDFHALRHTYISRIVRSGATPKACAIAGPPFNRYLDAWPLCPCCVT